MRTAQNHTFKLESIRASNALKVQSQSSFGLMMSYSSTFRKFKPGVDSLAGKALKSSDPKLLAKGKTERTPPPEWSVATEGFETPETNYRYNVLYNCFPKLQNTNESSKYFATTVRHGAVRSGSVFSRSRVGLLGDRVDFSAREPTQQSNATSVRGMSHHENRGFSSQGLRLNLKGIGPQENRGVSSQGNRIRNSLSTLSTARGCLTDRSTEPKPSIK